MKEIGQKIGIFLLGIVTFLLAAALILIVVSALLWLTYQFGYYVGVILSYWGMVWPFHEITLPAAMGYILSLCIMIGMGIGIGVASLTNTDLKDEVKEIKSDLSDMQEKMEAIEASTKKIRGY